MDNSFFTSELNKKINFLYKIDLWIKQGYNPTRYLDINNDLDEIEYEYNRIMYHYGKESKLQTNEYVSQIGKMFGVELTQDQIDNFFSDPGTSKLLDVIRYNK